MPSTNNPESNTAYDAFTENTDRVFDVQKAKFEYAKEKVALQLDNERWKNRRRMAWLALWAAILACIAMFTVVPESKIEKLDEVVAWFFMGMFSIVGTYIGTATWANVAQARNKTAAVALSDSPWDSYGGGRLNNDNPAAQKSDYYSEK
jgi:hypothetical protein